MNHRPASGSLRGRLGPPGRLGPLADDDDQHARLRDALRVFLQENGSYKATAERLILHKNSVQYRVRNAEEAPAIPSPTTDCLSSWPCWPAKGSAPPSSATRNSPGHSTLASTVRPQSFTGGLTIACPCLSPQRCR